LVPMPTLLSAAAVEAVQRRVLGATRERMLRELAEALEALTVERPLVLVLEDLHWSDAATLDLVAYLARRRGPARLLLLGTYRPGDASGRGHPLPTLTLHLQLADQGAALPLAALTMADVTAYLAARFGAGAVAAGVAAAAEVVEAQCADLAWRGQVLAAHGMEAWPDGTLTGRYGFQHTLYQQVIYKQIPVARRLRLHQRIGARLEAGYDPQA